MGTRKLLLLELNEVPYRVIDAYCSQRPSSHLARVLTQSAQYQTVTDDQILDPWISWSTFHRGVSDEAHQILHLGQVLAETDQQYPPIWRLLKERGITVGVFGSLHSSSLPANASAYSFYVPDYFDAKAFAHPRSLLTFQELNLAMTRQSARNVSRRVPLHEMAKFLASAYSLGIKPSTVADCAGQLIREVFDKSSRIRRRTYQPLVMADLFLGQLEKTQPAFATFYTNHVAAAMHRYWRAAFPDDLGERLDEEWIARYAGEITFAMDKLDLILGRLVKFIKKHPEYVLLIGSSMGQAAIPANATDEFLTITDLQKFMAQLGVPAGAWETRPAMVPCYCAVVSDEYRDHVVRALETLTIDGARIKKDKRPLHPMSYDERQRGFFQFFLGFDNYQGPAHAIIEDRQVELSALGLGMMAHEDGVNGTAQHVREGSLLVFNGEIMKSNSRERETISTLDIAPSIMRFFGLETPAYMRGAPLESMQSRPA